MPVSVGVLAALVNIFALCVLSAAGRAIELIVRRFASARLRRTRRTPIIHDSDMWVLNAPRSVVKYHRYPLILATILCSVLLIIAELVSDLGVNVSQKCSPSRQSGPVIAGSLGNATPVELGASALLLQSIAFYDGRLTSVPAGFPLDVSAAVCLPCLEKENATPLLSNCSVSDGPMFLPGELNISAKTTNGAFKTKTKEFVDLRKKDEPETIQGDGDVTKNVDNCAIFLVQGTKVEHNIFELLYLEYANNTHCNQMLATSREAQTMHGQGFPVWDLTASTVQSQNISCHAHPNITLRKFRRALQIYRTMQLEKNFTPVPFNEKESRFSKLKEDDIYRAVLAMLLLEDTKKIGSYFKYKQCGTYDWIFLLPLSLTVLLIIVLGMVTVFVDKASRIKIPYNSYSWYLEASRRDSRGLMQDWCNGRRSSYFSNLFDEMLLVDDGDVEAVRFKSTEKERAGENNLMNIGVMSRAQDMEYSDAAGEIELSMSNVQAEVLRDNPERCGSVVAKNFSREVAVPPFGTRCITSNPDLFGRGV